MTQTKLRTEKINANENITFPIGTAIAVRQCFSKLHLDDVLGKHKKRGRSLVSLAQALVTYRLSENHSISRASDWINHPQVLEEYSLDCFDERTLYRALTFLGDNRELIISDIQEEIFDRYDFEHTDVNMDWTSLVLHGEKCPIAKFGYSRDHRPDKKQITLGVAELASPINMPIGMTIMPGNTNDQNHFSTTFMQVCKKVRNGSLFIYDKGGSCNKNNDQVLFNKMKFLTAKKLNKCDDKIIKNFRKENAEFIDRKKGIYGIKIKFPSRINYFYFSESLREEQIQSSMRKAVRKFEEARLLQGCLDKGKKLPAKYRIRNELIEMQYIYQTKLKELGNEALEFIRKQTITGREGFFCLVSSEDLTLKQALDTYRKKDSVEKLINSLKNEIEIKPLRVWTTENIYGALIIGFIALLVISIIKFEHAQLKNVSGKFIKISLSNLTVTMVIVKNTIKKRIFANFDTINTIILGINQAVT